MKIYLGIIVTCLSAAFLTPCTAEVSSCKASHLKELDKIKEKGNGYVEAIQTDHKTKHCVEHINKKRLQKYQAIANEKKVPIEDVAMTAAEEIKKKDDKR